jgi:nucleotide-binding universal stress UspA family protein
MKIRKVLLTTDLSEESERPYAAVAQLARDVGAQVTLVHAVHDLVVAPHGAPLAPPLHAPDVAQLIDDANKVIQEHAKKFGDDLEVTTDVISGDQVAHQLADYAHENGFDLIAVSTHGRSGFRRMVMGSVAETLLRHSKVPVLVFPRQE